MGIPHRDVATKSKIGGTQGESELAAKIQFFLQISGLLG